MMDFTTFAASDAPDPEIFAAAERLARDAVGHDLLTIMRLHSGAMEVERLHSSRPGVYPPGGRKPKKDTDWGRHVLIEGRVHAGGEDAIRAAFADHETIFDLGLRYVLNLPLREGSVTVGTLNLLSATVDYAARDIGALDAIAAPLARRLSRSTRTGSHSS